MIKTSRYLLILFILILPTFSLMLRNGIYTMHDPHVFRIQQFDKCIQDRIFPCRWAADSGKGYGEPMFNYYGQAPYWATQFFITLGFSILNSAKSTFIASLVLSGFFMFMFSRRHWGVWGGLLSAVLYVYAPYRAVDVWVRGALPEALAFVLYPLILLSLDLFLEYKKRWHLVSFSLLIALLVIVHNLSFFMFAPFLFLYWLYACYSRHDFSSLSSLIPAGLFSFLLAAFYLIPVIFEGNLVTLSQTTTGYYDYHIHFTTLNELFISRFWGYGASLWARKYLSVSIGQLHWILPVFILLIVLLKRKIRGYFWSFIIFAGLGTLALFMTHGKSVFIWNHLPFLKYIQFPWRYLSIALFFLSFSGGYLARIFSSKIIIIVGLILTVVINFSFFRPDIWRDITDQEQFSGPLWDEGRSSSLSDFWPAKSAKLPTDFAPLLPDISSESGTVLIANKKSAGSSYDIMVNSPQAVVTFPIVNFPKWTATNQNGTLKLYSSGDLGLITTVLPAGLNHVTLKLNNTFPRTLGNLISLFTLLSLPLWFIKRKSF